MGYPQFNLTTLQLPAPASNMTKAEYKAAYGIDLDEVNIKAFKLVLLGNDKYPIEQIKEVEDGYEIYFNGRILSITDIVQTSDEVYDVANSKPIYWHGIDIYNEGSAASIHAHILNNTPTTFSSMSSIDSWFLSISGQVDLSCNGFLRYEEKNYNVLFIRKRNTNKFYVYAHEETASVYTNLGPFDSLSEVFTNIIDSVNKIN